MLSKLTDGLAEAELALPRQIVADIVVPSEPVNEADGSISVAIEALTIES